MTISKVNNIAYADLAKFKSVTKANLGKMKGVSKPSSFDKLAINVGNCLCFRFWRYYSFRRINYSYYKYVG